jgi:predicted DNA-binding protein
MAHPLRTRNYCLRLTDMEDQYLYQLATKLGEKTRARLLRKMIREAIEQGPDLAKDDLNHFREGVRQLAALGNNVNQIAHAIHAGRARDVMFDPNLLQAVSHQVTSLKKEIADLVMRSHKRWVTRDYV